MSSVGYRAARGPQTQGGGPGSRPSGGVGGAAGGGAQGARPEEAVAQLEAELHELRNLLALKDQRISELSRADAKEGRLKKDIRLLAGELRGARRQLADRGRAWQEERRQLLDRIEQLRAAPAAQEQSSQLHATPSHQSSGAQESRPRTPTASGAGAGVGASGTLLAPGASLGSGAATVATVATGAAAASAPSVASSVAATAPTMEETPIVYSSFHHERVASVGRQELQGIGVVEGALAVAKLLLQRVNGSYYNAMSLQQAQFTAGMMMKGMPAQQHMQMMQQHHHQGMPSGMGGMVMQPGVGVAAAQHHQMQVGMQQNM
mmetsp:Transcript_106780/g.298912  ORF Transcript_106780/g.298912 Transcript_106780/m.298912 type:complete len:320 (-) Transcript_106780:422-1381(-)